ncbi:MAG: hypothetical protein B7W98_03005, partial [Parcubacteria group bacterium 20-58-5]
MKRLVEIVVGLFILHTIEESVSRFWNTDPLTNAVAQMLHVQSFWLYWGGQALLYAFLAALLFTRNGVMKKYGTVVLAILLLAELEHLAAGLNFGYTPG